MTDPLEALGAEVERVGDFLTSVAAGDWERPTRCPPMSLREVAVHMLRGAYRISEFLAVPAGAGEPEKDAVSYYRYDAAAEGPVIVKRAQEESQKRPADADIAGEWRAAWRDALAAAGAVYGDDPVVLTPFGTLRLREYLKTRCIEVGIHAMDVRHAVGLEPDPAPQCLEVIGDVLRGLLGADLRSLGMDDMRFAHAGTGRGGLTAAEREMLGPLADSFPLLQ